MTIELKTGKKGELHISSEDDRLLHCRSFGTGAYVLSGCAVTMTSVNKAHIAEGELMVQGGYVRITGGGEDVAIANGVAGQKRNTIIALTYTRDSNGIEAMSFAAVDGTSTAGTPSDPTVTTNDINAGASSSMWKFARIRLDGLTVGTPQVLFTTKAAALLDQISSLSSQVASLQDSVSQINQYPGGMSGNVIDQSWHVLPLGGNRVVLVFEASPWYTALAKKEYYYEAALPIEVKKVLFSCAESTQWRCDRTRVTFNEGDTTVMKIAVNIDRDASGGTAAEPFYITIKAMIIAAI